MWNALYFKNNITVRSVELGNCPMLIANKMDTFDFRAYAVFFSQTNWSCR